ncbi:MULTISPECIES: FAD/NAD(P)-binding protein [Photorhabdus]|uniref:FAD-dependent urate hydroxylase HpyO/Asp monooxygenase CreE-like FAD/NAD(P)-binding domain-containing protein n=2 Tax=Photorhabdus asymbiotica TaxID=291112 RepID=C7BSG2_PHOAA|nr:FAD/NAD(P)-binding protein [Photorhabdus asymbiotica]RKS66592.1 putative NAD(P)/FAD-binding protein YdhS [Photorhabdus asymbiotica]CAQ83465.1 conserved hypothetical protein [Photorhabdus asymbiotica]
MNIGIIGSGAGCISILKHLLQYKYPLSSILIFSKDHNQVGFAYKDVPEVFIMNTRLDSLTQFNDVIGITDWLIAKKYDYCDDDYLPRRVYGNYLQDVKSNLIDQLKKIGIVVHTYGKADYVDEEGNIICNGTCFKIDASVLSIGFGKDILNEHLFDRIASLPYGGTIDVYGSGLTSIDILLYISTYRPDLKMQCYSLSGRFPRVRGKFKAGGASIFDDYNPIIPSFKSIIQRFKSLVTKDIEKDILFNPLCALKDEVEYCSAYTPVWQEKLYNGTMNYLDFYQKLSRDDQVLLHNIRHQFIETRAMFPLVNARKLATLIDDGQLSISSRRYNPTTVNKNSILAFNPVMDLEIIQMSCLPMHFISGVDVDRNCKVNDKRNIYVLGPMTNGSRFFTEATSLTVRDAKLIVDALIISKEGQTHELVRYC